MFQEFIMQNKNFNDYLAMLRESKFNLITDELQTRQIIVHHADYEQEN